MKLKRILTSPQSLLLGGLLAAGAMSGCQATIGGQTLPSATYLRDDVQFFPTGPEEQLFYQRKAIRDYEAAEAQLNGGGVSGPGVPPAPSGY